jgi:hypothetical protein
MRGRLTAELPTDDGARLRVLGSEIRDLAHLEALVAQTTPAMRAEVRKLLATIVPFDVPPPGDPDAA